MRRWKIYIYINICIYTCTYPDLLSFFISVPGIPGTQTNPLEHTLGKIHYSVADTYAGMEGQKKHIPGTVYTNVPGSPEFLHIRTRNTQTLSSTTFEKFIIPWQTGMQHSSFRGMRVWTWKKDEIFDICHTCAQHRAAAVSLQLPHPRTHTASSAFSPSSVPYYTSSHTAAQQCQHSVTVVVTSVASIHVSGIKVNCLWCFFVSCWRAVSTTDRFAPNVLLLLTNCCCFVCTVCSCHVRASYMTLGAL